MRFPEECNCPKTKFFIVVLLLMPFLQQAQIISENRNLVPVWGEDDYRPDLFLNATSQDSLPPFDVFFDWGFDYNALEETDTSGFFRYIIVGVDSVNSLINYQYYNRKEEIGRTILNILELHRREMLAVFFEFINESNGDAEAANLAVAVVIGALQLSMGMFPTAFGASINEDSPEWMLAIEDIKASCENTLDRYKRELAESRYTILFSVRDSVRRALQSKESGVLRSFSKNFYGFSYSLGAQSNAMIGRLQSPGSFTAIRPIFGLDLYINQWHVHGAFAGLSFDKQNGIQMGDVTLQDQKRNFAVSGHVSLAYAFRLNDRWRVLPEISRINIAFREEVSDDDELDTKFFEASNWGWGIRFQQQLTASTEYRFRHVHLTDAGIEYFFRHHLYSIPQVGSGHLFTFGLSAYLGIKFHKKRTMLY